MGPVEGVCRAGECIFVPRGWWHCVMNVDDEDSACIAITHNYVSDANLRFVLRFLRDMRYAVSGVPPEEADSLYERFVEALKEHRPAAWARVADEFDETRAAQAAAVEAGAGASASATGGTAGSTGKGEEGVGSGRGQQRWADLIGGGGAASGVTGSSAASSSSSSSGWSLSSAWQAQATGTGTASASSTAAASASASTGSSTGKASGFSFGFAL